MGKKEVLRTQYASLKNNYRYVSRKLRWFTPIGEADSVVRSELSEEEKESKHYDNYRFAYKKYRYFKRFEITIKVLFYAGIITSAAAAFGFGLEIIDRLASYIGFSVLLAAYIVSSYMAMRAKENLYIKREVLLSRV